MNPRKFAALSLFIVVSLLAFSPTSSSALEIKRMKLSNGAVLLVSEEHQLPMVTMAIAFDAGARRDPKGEAGLANLTAASLMEGTEKLTAAQFNEKIDFMGSDISIGASRDYTIASLTTLKKYETPTLDLLAQALEDPGLRDADIERKRAQEVADIKASEEDPGYAATVAFIKTFFGSGPYGHPTEGYVDTVSKLTPKDVRDFYHQYYKIGSAVIAVAGDVKADQVKAELEKELTGLKGTVPPQPVPATIELPQGVHLNLINRNVAQANLMLGSSGIDRSNPDYYRLQVMNYILGGGGFASRLMETVRSKAGLAYSIGSYFQADKFPGAFVVVLQTKNSSANEALKMIFHQIRLIQRTPVSTAELDAAKKYLVGSFPLKLDRQSQIVGFMLQIQLANLGLDYADRYPKLIDAVTVEQVHEMAQKYLHPDNMLLVAVANQKEANINVKSLEPEKQAAAAKH